jgi:hypothetical protein
LHWVNAYYEVKYDIYINGTFVTSVGANVVRHKLDNLQSGTAYTIAIVANNGQGGLTAQTVVFKTTDSLGWLPAVYNVILN